MSFSCLAIRNCSEGGKKKKKKEMPKRPIFFGKNTNAGGKMIGDHEVSPEERDWGNWDSCGR